MTLEIGFLFALLIGMVFLFLTEKLPVDLTAFIGLVILIFGGYLTPSEAFTGFSSPAVITMLSVFIVGAALLETGVADLVGGRIHTLVGNSEVRLIIVLMVVCGILSAFMNNIAATAVLMPAVAAVARKSGISPSRLFMPLAFGAILGGTTTLVGTPPNIVAAQVMQERGMEPFSLFDFTPIGVALLAVGCLFMVTIGRKLLPNRDVRGPAQTGTSDLTQVYRLTERLFSIRIPPDSPLDGLSLSETRLGTALGVKALAIVREGSERRLAPEGAAILNGGDVLFVEGSAEDLSELLRLQSLAVEKADLQDLPTPVAGVTGIRARVAEGSPLAGRTLRELRFREQHGMVVIGIRQDGLVRRTDLASCRLAAGDEVLALASGESAQIEVGAEFDQCEKGMSAISELGGQVFLLGIPEGSSLAGAKISSSRLADLVGLTIAGIVRGDEMRLAVDPDETLNAGDRLLVAAEPSRILTLIELGDVQMQQDVGASLESRDVGMVEVAVAPRSGVVGKSVRELNFRERYGLLAVALWRDGEPRHAGFSELPLKFGDAMLLHGSRDRIRRLAADPDFVVLSEAAQPRSTRKAPLAFAALVFMIGLVATGYQPIHVAAFSAATLVLFFRTLSMEQAYRAIEWRAVFLVAAVLPVGLAMERTGAALLMADSVTSVAGGFGNHAILAALVVLASLLSQGLDGAPAVVLLAPVVIGTAESLGISARPLMMGVSLAASAAFMTPFSHKANLLVMGAGGYRARDYVKVGTPLTIVVVAMIVLMVPIFFPF